MTTTERLATESIEANDAPTADFSEEQSGFVEASPAASSDNDLSPEDLVHFNDGILGMLVAVGRISLEDKIALQATGSRAGEVRWWQEPDQ